MPIQFRSRITGIITPMYQDQQGSDNTGWCCSLNRSTDFYTCKQANGYWIRGAENNQYCPNLGSGCQDSGQLNQNPGACCHWIINGTEYENTCAYVQNEQTCKDLHKAPGINYNYWPGITCYSSSNPLTTEQQTCNGVKLFSDSDDGYTRLDDGISESTCNSDESDTRGKQCFDWDDQWGNCCTQDPSNPESIACSITLRSNCKAGFWSKSTYNRTTEKKIKTCSSTSCSSVKFSTKTSADLPLPPEITTTNFNTTTDPLLKNPIKGNIYQGGIFVGVFDKAAGTTVKGIKKGEESDGIKTYQSTPNTTPYQSKPNKWALIIAPEDTQISSNTQIQYNNTSIGSRSFSPSTLSDGIIGTFGGGDDSGILLDLPNKIRSIKINGFSDWYIPSKEEWDFFFYQNIDADIVNTNKRYEKYEYKKLKEGNYWSSTAANNTDNISFNYSFSTYPTYGYTSSIPITSKIYLRLFRRIYLS